MCLLRGTIMFDIFNNNSTIVAHSGQVACFFCGPVYFQNSHYLPINGTILKALKEVQLDKMTLCQTETSTKFLPLRRCDNNVKIIEPNSGSTLISSISPISNTSALFTTPPKRDMSLFQYGNSAPFTEPLHHHSAMSTQNNSFAFSSEPRPGISSNIDSLRCSRKLDFFDSQSVIHMTDEEDNKAPPKYYSSQAASVPAKRSAIKVTPIDYCLPSGHPSKCSRPECHHKKFTSKDGYMSMYCSKWCERSESVKKF